MSKTLLVASLPFLALSACTDDLGGPTTPLSAIQSGVGVEAENNPTDALGNTRPSIDLTFGGGPSAVATETGPCPRVSDDVKATFDGAAMTLVQRGGWSGAWDGTYDCDPIELELDGATPAPGLTSTIVISEGSTTWTIAGVDMLTADFTLVQAPTREGQPAVLSWPSASAFHDTPYIALLGQGGGPETTSAPVVSGNTVSFTIPPHATSDATIQISADRDVTATTCDGPSSCYVNLAAGAQFTMTVP
ncbi:MAG TPA: hypothetical protein VLX92_01070 [Kofleriaceae bacterium]|nr:hypothetical protein [Kofleriaceae bacterium]